MKTKAPFKSLWRVATRSYNRFLRVAVAVGCIILWGMPLRADDAPAPVESKAEGLTNRIKDLGGLILIDASAEVTGVLKVDKYLSLVEISTPTTPAANHARIWLNASATGTKQELRIIFDDGTSKLITSN